MKKIALILTILFAALSMTAVQTQAQCEPGYSFTTVTLTVHGCTYHVDICYLCSTGPVPSVVKVQGFMKVDQSCTQTWDANQVLQDIFAQVRNPYFVFNILCNPHRIPPCPTQNPVKFIQLTCWYQQPNGLYKPCENTAYCYWIKKFCTDGFIVYEEWVEYPTMVGTPDCTIEAGDAQIGDCFIYHTECGN